jgi:fibronectin-binding autotransporter adhesin
MGDSRTTAPSLPLTCTSMRGLSRRRVKAMLAAAIAVSPMVLTKSANAASATWSATPTDSTWEASGSENNWSTGPATFPGSTSATTSTDVATFAGTSTQQTITISSSSLNIGSIVFGSATGATAGAYTIGTASGTNPLLLTNGGSIIDFDTQASNITYQTINAPLTLENSGGGLTGSGAYSFVSNGTGTNGTEDNFLLVNGSVTGNAASGSTSTLTLTGKTNTENIAAVNQVAGTISDGSNGGKLAVAVGYTSSGSTTWILSGTNTYSGGTTLSGTNYSGGLGLGSSSALGTGALVISGHTGEFVSAYAAGLTVNNAITFNTSATLNPQGYTFTLGGTLSGTSTSNVTENGSGTLVLTGSNTYSGGTTLTTGTLDINYGGSSSSNSAIGTGSLLFNGGTVANTSGSPVTLATNNALTLNQNVTFIGTSDLNLGTGAVSLGTTAIAARTITVNSNTLTIGGSISNGTGTTPTTAITKAGSGTLTLSGSSTYSGATSLNAGTLQLLATAANTTAGVSSVISASALSLASGTTLGLRGDGNITFADAGVSLQAANSTQTFDVGHISTGSGNTLTLSGAIAVSDTVTTTFNVTDSTGSGDTLGLGTLTVQQGTLALNSTTANLTIAGIVGTSTSGNNIITTNGAGNVTFGNITASSGKSLNLTVGTVSGTTGTVTLSGTDSFNGANGGSTVALDSGTLILNSTAALNNLQHFNIAGGSFDAMVASVTVPSPAQTWSGDFTFVGTNSLNLGAGSVTLSGSSRQVTVLANTLTVGGAIGDGGSGFGITKLGSGTLVLGGSNTYSGVTTISAGKVRIINTSGSATGSGIVSLDGVNTTLSGTGISTGALTVTDGGRLAPGLNTVDADGSGHTNFGNAGKLSVGTSGGLTLTSANLDFDLGATGSSGGVAASGNDTIATGGALTLTSVLVNINELSSSGATTLDMSSPYILISGAASLNGGTTALSNLSGFTTDFIGSESYTATYSTNGTDLEVTFSDPVSAPEPGSLSLFALSGLGLLRRRRRVLSAIESIS